MIIFGSKMYGKKNRVRSHGRCQHCGKYSTQESYDGRSWGHLYFIPLIPDGDKVRVIRECKSCRKGNHFPLKNVPEIAQRARNVIDQAIVAIGAGETHSEMNGERFPALGTIANNIQDVYCFLGEQEILSLIEPLRTIGAKRELTLAEAKLAEVAGRRPEADAKFKHLADNSEEPLILFHCAQYLNNTSRPEMALSIAEKLESSLVEDLGVKQLLLECYESTKQWDKVANTYENCFLLVPELWQDKDTQKRYKKTCKKAGRKPKPQPE